MIYNSVYVKNTLLLETTLIDIIVTSQHHDIMYFLSNVMGILSM